MAERPIRFASRLATRTQSTDTDFQDDLPPARHPRSARDSLAEHGRWKDMAEAERAPDRLASGLTTWQERADPTVAGRGGAGSGQWIGEWEDEVR